MILAAGLSPAWQQTVILDALRVGEVNRAREVQWCASGKVINVGLALQALTASPSLSQWGPGGVAGSTQYPVHSTQSDAGGCKTLALIGGPGGDAIRAEFAELGIAARWVESRSPTRVCTTILDGAAVRTTELVENARSASAAEIAEFVAVYGEEADAADVVVLTGSLPEGAPPTLYRTLLAETQGRAIVDCQGNLLLAALDQKPFLIKPNREELSRTLGRSLTADDELHSAMRELNRRGAEWVVVTDGKEAVWASSAVELHRFQPPVVEVVNPIGCGDCFAAGVAWGLANGCDVIESVRIGIAAAGENARDLLPGRFDASRVQAIAASVEMRRV